MTLPEDDDDLARELRSAIAAQQSTISLPDGSITRARRAARRRTMTRTVTAGVAASVASLAVIAAATGFPGSRPAHSPGVSSSAPPIRGGSAEAQDTAYLVRRISRRTAGDALGDIVFHNYFYTNGREASDGSLVDLGAVRGNGYSYTTPDGRYFGSGHIGPGSLTSGFVRTSRLPGGRLAILEVGIDNVDRTYSEQRLETSSSTPPRAPFFGLASSPDAVRRALRSGRVTRLGTTSVAGVEAIVLAEAATPDTGVSRRTLYVDARTYQPLRTVEVVSDSDGGHYIPGIDVTDWLPATTRNIALATHDTIPAGYTRVAHADPR